MSKQIQKSGAGDMNKLFDALLGEGFAELRLERTVYKAESCDGVPVVGHIIDFMNIRLEDADRDWPVFIFRTTKPTKGVDRNGDVIDVGVDEEILVTGSAQVLPVLMRYARDPEVMYEVALLPKSKIDIGGGKSMWTFKAAISQKPPTKREGAFKLQGAEPRALGTTANGAAFDAKTGEVLQAQG